MISPGVFILHNKKPLSYASIIWTGLKGIISANWHP